MIQTVKVIAVDDQVNELDDIVTGLHGVGIACLGLMYDQLDGVASAIGSPYIGVRIVFTDLNLQEHTNPSPEQTVGPIAEVLSNILSTNNGPYALVFWSKHTYLKEQIGALLRERYNGIALPTVIEVINKHEVQDPSELLKRITEVIQSSDQLCALMSWESRVSEASSKTLSMLYDLTSSISRIPHEIESSLDVMLSKLSHESIGFRNAIKNHVLAVESGLEPILLDNLNNLNTTKKYSEIWAKALTRINDKNLALPNGISASKLNSVFHLDLSVESEKKEERGVFVKLSDQYHANDKFSSLFGKTKNEIYEEFISFEGHGLRSDEKQSKKDRCNWGMLEISAACDYAQQKSRTYRYLLCLLIPIELEEYTFFGDDKRDRRHEAIYRCPVFQNESGEFVMKVNFRYLIGLPKNNDVTGATLFRVRNQLLDIISDENARYSARLGMLSFR